MAFMRLRQCKRGDTEPNGRGFINLCQDVNMVVEYELEEGGEEEESDDDDYQPHNEADYSELLATMANLGIAQTERRGTVAPMGGASGA